MENSLDITDFFTSYREFSDNVLREFATSFQKLRDDYTQIRDDYLALNKTLAEHFNIFHVLGVSQYEVTTHSALLRDFLDSTGTHGQGNQFFMDFLLILAEKNIIPKDEVTLYTPITFDNYSCEAEKVFEAGRIDIIISRLHGEFPFGIIIENKVYASDQEKQIERYWLELDKMNIPQNRKKIIYLSPDGHLPSEYSISPEMRTHLESIGVLHCISYKKDIRGWLENVLPKIESQKIKYLVEQYIDVLRLL